MINKPRLWLCGITQDRLKDIEEMTNPEVMEHFDGLVFTDGFSKDGTYELLNDRKKQGKIVRRKWTNDHDFQMNEFMRAGTMSNGDWFVLADSPDRVNIEWAASLREQIEELDSNNIGAINMNSKIHLAKYFDHMFFFPNPHWGLQGIVSKVLFFEEEEKQKCIRSNRFDDPAIPALAHPAKYYYVYGRSNHCQLLYGRFGQEVHNFHEANRLRFRLHCEKALGLDLSTLDSLEDFYRKNDFSDEFINAVDLEVNLKDYFRYKVLGQDFVKEIDKNRINWSFRIYLDTKDKEQTETDYIGPINKYLTDKGEEQEGPQF
jgi:hypothetical protein